MRIAHNIAAMTAMCNISQSTNSQNMSQIKPQPEVLSQPSEVKIIQEDLKTLAEYVQNITTDFS